MFELIDTLWNVNRQLKSQVRDSNIELIDTLWNVNQRIFKNQKTAAERINRYIMECKY